MPPPLIAPVPIGGAIIAVLLAIIEVVAAAPPAAGKAVEVPSPGMLVYSHDDFVFFAYKMSVLSNRCSPQANPMR